MKEFMKFIITVFLGLLLCGLLLAGCARDTKPLTEINDGIQQMANEIVDYAQNNMVIDSDKQYLLQGVKDCAARADAMTKAYAESIDKCAAEKSKLKTERNSLGALLILLVLWLLRSPLKSLGKKFLGL